MSDEEARLLLRDLADALRYVKELDSFALSRTEPLFAARELLAEEERKQEVQRGAA